MISAFRLHLRRGTVNLILRENAVRCLILLALLLSPFAARAECVGTNLLDSLAAEDFAAIALAASEVPFARGNLWQATRGGDSMTLVGTFHLDDPRHDRTMADLAEPMEKATALLVEAGPEEEAALKAEIAAHPERLVNTSGPTLPESLPADDWARLSDALRARGVPPFMAAKLQPWYVASVLAIPPCQFGQAAVLNGLDRRLLDLAAAQDIPVMALEPFDTVFTIFDSFDADEQRALLMQTLDSSAADDDMAVTLAETYFSGQSRLFWEYSKLLLRQTQDMTQEEVESEFAAVEEPLILTRNRAWIAPIEAAAAKGPVVVAFGALHLSGEEGVLNLLAQRGWTLKEIKP